MDRYLRVRAGRLQTSIRTWVHPGGRRATLVAMVHVGDLGYYQQVRQVIDRMEAAGAVVLCENYTLPETPPESNTDEAAAFADLDRLMHLTRARAAEMGWTLQADAMTPAATWRPVDVDPLTLLRLTGIEPMRLRLHRMTAILDFDEGDRIAAARYRVKTALWWRLAASRIGSRLTSPTDPTLLRPAQQGHASRDGCHQPRRDPGLGRPAPAWPATRVARPRLPPPGRILVHGVPPAQHPARPGHQRVATPINRQRRPGNGLGGPRSDPRQRAHGHDQYRTGRHRPRHPHLIGDVPDGSSAVRARFPGQGGGSEPAN